MKQYNKLRKEVSSIVSDNIVTFQNSSGVVFNISAEDDLLIITVQSDSQSDIKSVSFGKVSNTYTTNNNEINTVVLKNNKEYIEESISILKRVMVLINEYNDFKEEQDGINES